MITIFSFILLSLVEFSMVELLAIQENYFSEESLSPYISHHGSRLSHRSIQECHQKEFGSPPHELYLAHKSLNFSSPYINIKHFIREIPVSPFTKRTIRGHYITVSDPLKTFSVLEPDQAGGCSLNIRQTVTGTSKKGNCTVAINAGYFDTKQGTCYGNVISNGQRAHDSKGIQNVHFGITEDGQIFIGYLSREQFISGNFKQLVGGVVWIVRNGTGFVNDSKILECEDTEETGPMDHFVNILSARSVVGHDKDGKLVLVQVDGKSEVDGINLLELQGLLKEFGVVNAVNLDGGGSSTLVINGVTLNYPYDICPGEAFSCDRKVSSIICIHSPYCEPEDCNNHGVCSDGECICEKNWLAPKCDQILCEQYNCSDHGVCLVDGCKCHPGYFGDDCEKSCPEGWYGRLCSERCDCVNSFGCNPFTGICSCKPGYMGKRCDYECSDGYFGLNCQFKCQCEDACYCHPASGTCDVPQNTSVYTAAKCLAKSFIQEQHLVKDNTEEKRRWYLTIVILGVITTMCITSFLLIMFCSCSCVCRNEQLLCGNKERRRYKKYPLQIPSGDLSDTNSENEFYPMKNIPKR